ncbi:DNA translocase FtsK [Pseudoponticoccus marisrubri]|uniref:DNA translocase FtsK n=1 Tax=Pseudoponticoccus marisrubri TaxID=1685382 RepID=A0A0W7WKL2_9RHOB|nr:DNA translocase FtsK [Pseudoponticoccus marisrubri]KUF11060.1 cell division protein FtsK [Pseudoponticoccus marisrubri]
MASFQARGRDPLFDANTAATLEKRGRELIGLLLVALGLMAAAMIASYTPDDPSWVTATDAPVQNWMGSPGAYIAAPLFMIVGLGSWAIALVLIVWGARLALHRNDGRALSCLVFAPIWIALCSVYASGLPESTGWSHDFGMGGLFGDMMMGSVLNLMPVSPALALKIVQLLMGLVILGFGAFVLGFTRPELSGIARFLLIGVVMVYAQLMRLVGRGAAGALSSAQKMRAAQAERRARAEAEAAEAAAWVAAQEAVPAPSRVRRAETAPDMPLVEDPMAEDDLFDLQGGGTAQAAPEKGGFLSRMPSLMRRNDPMPEPELVETPVADLDMEAPGEDRVRAKIARAIKSRRHSVPQVPLSQPDPSKPLTKGRGHGPQPLIFKPTPKPVDLPPEPPVTGPRAMPAEPPLTASRAMPEASAAPSIRVSADPAPQPRMAEPAVDAAAEPSGRPQFSTRVPETAPAPAAEPRPQFAARAPEPELRPEPQIQPEPEMQPEPDSYGDDYGALSDFDDYGDEPEDRADAMVEDFDDAQRFDSAPEAPAVPIQRGAVTPAVPEPRKVVQQPQRKPFQPSKRAQAEAQPTLGFDETEVEYELPPLNLLMSPDQIQRHHLSDEALEENARMLESVLDDYGVKGEIVSVRPGPVVTMYELEPAPGLKASRVIGLADDIARSMSALSARVSTVPGRSVIGIELPNDKREMVCFREILAGRDFGDGNHKLPLALGKDIGGDPVVANLAKMPHLLIAGTTGSGKSVAINTMILSLLYKLTPDECRLIMIDPKMLELSVYDGIPHLLSPVVTDPKKAVVALKWVVGEMEDRYRKMSKMGVRNIDGYNSRVEDAQSKGEMFSRTVQTGFDDETGEPVFETEEFEPKKMAYIVVIVDEMADLMMVAGKEIEACIQRLAQMARASGIHLIMATQRPSVDVITGTIKANFPTRISFQVTSKIDSRTILGEMGAEQLLGMGDMLYMAGGAKITRCHGPFVSDEEVEEIVNHLKAFGPPDYVGGVVQGPDEEKADNIDAVLGLNTGGNTNGEDALYDQAVGIVVKDRKCSTSYIQRKLGIGYNKAARLVEQMEDEGVVSAANHVGKREILVPEQ